MTEAEARTLMARQGVREEAEAPKGERKAPARSSRLAPGLMALLFGVPIWIVGARYTLDGWVMALNVVSGVADLPIQLARPTGFWSLLLFPIGLGYSLVETRYRPRRARAVIAWLLWVIVLATDYGSTYLAVATPTADAWPVTKWVAATLPAALAWTTVLAFLPEQRMMAASLARRLAKRHRFPQFLKG